MLPSLRAEYEQAARELQQEEADIAELQNSDKDYLNELKVSIAEQESVCIHCIIAFLLSQNFAGWNYKHLSLVLRRQKLN